VVRPRPRRAWYRAPRVLRPFVPVAALASLLACEDPFTLQAAQSTVDSAPEEQARAGEPLRPLPQAVAGDPRKVALGRLLFRERALSGDGSVACIDCHLFEHGGADPRPRSRGSDGRVGATNSPSVFNLEFQGMYGWSGEARTLAEHIALPLGRVAVMDMDDARMIGALTGTASARGFAAVYADGLTAANVRDALIAYERSLVTPNAAIDRFLRGDAGALTPEQLQGYRLFKSHGCASCHQGTNAGGNLLQRFGVFGDYFAERGDEAPADQGRFNITGREEDRHVFRVPSLRNVALTAPYFHDGSAATLEEAIDVMARFQLGRSLGDAETAALAAFLTALTGDLPRETGE
jgi:cytochrome c peroxidase